MPPVKGFFFFLVRIKWENECVKQRPDALFSEFWFDCVDVNDSSAGIVSPTDYVYTTVLEDSKHLCFGYHLPDLFKHEFCQLFSSHQTQAMNLLHRWLLRSVIYAWVWYPPWGWATLKVRSKEVWALEFSISWSALVPACLHPYAGKVCPLKSIFIRVSTYRLGSLRRRTCGKAGEG